jgi:uncharacterized protein
VRLPADERTPWLDSYIDQLLTRDVAELSARPSPERLRQYFEAYAINTAGVVSKETLNTAAGIAKATGDSYEGLLRNLLIVDVVVVCGRGVEDIIPELGERAGRSSSGGPRTAAGHR